MNKLEKAQANLGGKDIPSKIENDTLYIFVGDSELELSEAEIDFQAEEWYEEKVNEWGEMGNITYFVDIPQLKNEKPSEEWKNVKKFCSEKEAIEYAMEHFNADEKGRVSLISNS